MGVRTPISEGDYLAPHAATRPIKQRQIKAVISVTLVVASGGASGGRRANSWRCGRIWACELQSIGQRFSIGRTASRRQMRQKSIQGCESIFIRCRNHNYTVRAYIQAYIQTCIHTRITYNISTANMHADTCKIS